MNGINFILGSFLEIHLKSMSVIELFSNPAFHTCSLFWKMLQWFGNLFGHFKPAIYQIQVQRWNETNNYLCESAEKQI